MPLICKLGSNPPWWICRVTGFRRWLLGSATLLLIAALIIVWRAPEIAAWSMREDHAVMNNRDAQLDAPARWVDDYYVIEDLGGGAFAIGEPLYGQCNFSYLIVGTMRALLFDAGPGVRDILPVVRSLTTLPLLTLPSHLHFDHSGNLARVGAVALPDLPALRRQNSEAGFALGFYQYLGFIEGSSRPAFKVAQWLRPDSAIDLGGRQLTLISVPGHTPESVVLWEPQEQRMFSGDFLYPSQIYAFLPGSNLSDYAASAHRVSAMISEDTVLFGAHGCDVKGHVSTPRLRRHNLVALEGALSAAREHDGPLGRGWYPRVIAVDERMTLLARYPWMAQ